MPFRVLATHERRRSKVIRTVKALDKLTEVLTYKGYDLKLSSVYLHLLSRNSRTLEGTRHVHTAPIKFLKSKNSKDSSHVSTTFTGSSNFGARKKLFLIQWMTKLKCQLVSQQRRNKLLCLCIWNIKLLYLTMISLLALNIN